MEDHYQPGSTVAVRLPKDVPQEVLDRLNELKSLSGRKFSKHLLDYLYNAILSDTRMSDNLYISLPAPLSDEQNQMLNTPMQRRVLGHVIYHMLTSDSPMSFESMNHESQKSSSAGFSQVHQKMATQIFDLDDD